MNKTPVVLKPGAKNMKNHNRNQNKYRNNKTYSQNPQNQNKQQPPSWNNDSSQFSCYNCGKPGHLAQNCRNMRVARPAPQANLTIDQLVAMISEVNLVDGS
ncbi:hypothetical protein LWI29_011236 [Acer saccharum]|uniref:CCHC-type domain-containing protein n=1 Tax=Acer saccharum TaxID=4024 RepID=A0AA39VQJ2_ACESA|nr:hypothetical protein LWI29_011236 [Acer saccharum]